VATSGTYAVLSGAGVPVRELPKLSEGRPNIADLITNREVALLINTPTRRGPKTDEGKIRALATLHNVMIITTVTGAKAAVDAIAALRDAATSDKDPSSAWAVRPLQDYFPDYRRG
jgi:carbamoyl-phosphate synthase large subunit